MLPSRRVRPVTASERCKLTVFGVCSQLAQHSIEGSRLFYLLHLITASQLAALPLVGRLSAFWPSRVFPAVQAVLGVLAPRLDGAKDASWIVTSVVAAGGVLAVQLVLLAVLAYREVANVHSKASSGALPGWLGLSLRVSATALQLPSLLAFTIGLLSADTATDSVMMQQVMRWGCGLGLALHIAVTAVFCLMVFRQFPFEKYLADSTCFACAHGRIEFLCTILRATIVCGCAIVLCKDPTADITWTEAGTVSLLVVCPALLISALYAVYLPFYVQERNQFLSGLYALVMLAGLALGSQVLLDQPSNLNGVVLLIASVPFVYRTATATTALRARRLLAVVQPAALSPYTVEVYMRLKYLTLPHKAEFRFQDEAEKAYRGVVENAPRSPFLNLYVAALSMTCSNKIVFAVRLVRQARESSLSVDLEYQLFHQQRRNDASSSAAIKSSVNYLQVEEKMKELREAVLGNMKANLHFWEYMMNESVASQQLLARIDAIHATMVSSKEALAKLHSLAGATPEVLRLQALHMRLVMNDRGAAERALASAKSKKLDKGSRAAVCVISGDLVNLGEIINLTDGMAEMFGVPRAELIGHNVSVLCPPPFDEVHDLFLRRFATTDTDFEFVSRRVFGVHAGGYIMALELTLTPSLTPHGELVLSGEFERSAGPAHGESSHFMMCDVATSTITATSEHFCAALDIDENDVHELRVVLGDVIPELEGHPDLSVGTARFEATNKRTYSVRAERFRYSHKADVGAYEVDIIVYYLAEAASLGSDDAFDLSTLAAMRTFDPSGRRASSSTGGTSRGSPEESVGSDSEDDDDDEEEEDVTTAIPSGFKRRVLAEWPGRGRKPGASFRVRSSFRRSWGTGMHSSKLSHLQSGSRLRDGHGSVATSSLFGEDRLDAAGSLDRIHKKIKNNLKKPDGKMRHFARLIRLFILGMGSLVASESLLQQFMHANIRDIAVSVKQISELSSAIAKTSTLVLAGRSPMVHAGDDSFSRNLTEPTPLLRESTDRVADLLASIATLVRESKDDELDGLVFSPDVQLITDDGATQNVSQYVGLLAFVSEVEVVLHGKQTLFPCESACRFVSNNGMFEVQDRMDALLGAMQTRLLASVVLQLTVSRVALAVFILTLSASFVVLFVPIFVENRRREFVVSRAISTMPIEAGAHMLARYRRRVGIVEGTQVSLTPEEEALEEEEDTQSFVPIKVLDIPLSMPMEQVVKKTEENVKLKVTTRKIMTALRTTGKGIPGSKLSSVAPDPTPFQRTSSATKKRRRSLSMATDRWYVLRTVREVSQVGLAFWVFLALFFFLILEEETFLEAAEGRLLTLEAAARRVSLAWITFFWSTMPTDVLAWERRSLRVDLERLAKYTVEQAQLDRALKFGDEGLSVLPFTDTEGAQFELYFQDACDSECRSFLVAAGDDTQGAEMLQYGLVLAFDELASKVSELKEALVAYDARPSAEAAEQIRRAKLELRNLEPMRLLGKQLEESVKNELDTFNAMVEESKSGKLRIAAMAAVLLSFSHALAKRVFRRLERDSQKVQHMLFTMPPSSFKHVPELTSLLDRQQQS